MLLCVHSVFPSTDINAMEAQSDQTIPVFFGKQKEKKTIIYHHSHSETCTNLNPYGRALISWHYSLNIMGFCTILLCLCFADTDCMEKK